MLPFLTILTTAALTVTLALAPVAHAADDTVRPVRIVLIGDSTVCNYPATRPDRGWGQQQARRWRTKAATLPTSTKKAPGRWPIWL